VAGYLSAPLFIDREYQGSLNLYGTTGQGFGTLDVALLELYTTLPPKPRCAAAAATPPPRRPSSSCAPPCLPAR
jgi:hypothetical protein